MFRMLWIPLLFTLVTVAWPASAQDSKLDLRRDAAPRISASQDHTAAVVSPTPEMWFYEQERSRLDDPKMAVRRRAELKGAQRQDRIAAMEWYGFSNSRPSVTATPLFGSYSPHWASNTSNPMRWRPASAPIVVLRPSSPAY